MAAAANLFELLRGKPSADQFVLFKTGDVLAFCTDVIHHAEMDAVHFVLLTEEIAEERRLIKSSTAEVMRDIDGILAWAYSERFERRGAGLARITAADVQMILAQQRKSERKILFLLIVYCATGQSVIKQTSIAYITGYTRMTVIRAMHNLEERGVIRRSADKTVFKDGFFKAAKTRYEVIRPKATRGMMRVNVCRKRLKEDFDRVFCDTIEQLKNGEVKKSGND